MDGIKLITEERIEQITKHKFDANHDSNPFDKKNDIDALKVAGALIAAEIDRLLLQKNNTDENIN